MALTGNELEAAIKALEKKIEKDRQKLLQLRKRLQEYQTQEEERRRYISSKEILDLIYEYTGKKSNLSTIKRWADEGYLGEVVDEKEKFWALKTKQGKKRFLYPKTQVYAFLLEKGFLKPKYEILDRVRLKGSNEPGVVVNAYLAGDHFRYTVQLERSGKVLQQIKEEELRRESAQESD
ncbi:hypothetical protein BSNK01_25700 [Bacillaceae bacterium]